MKTIEDQIACAKRELAIRERVYVKWVSTGKMTEAQYHHEIECMEAIASSLGKLASMTDHSQSRPLNERTEP